jgi:signal transduction histidine kinase
MNLLKKRAGPTDAPPIPQEADAGVKILLVDDLKGNLIALEGLLRRYDVEIFKAKSGREALEFMMRHEFALALIDVQMPGMTGFELAELMRGAKRTRAIPIIFGTATAKDQSFSFKGYESGAVDFLLKPLDTYAVKSKVSIFIELFRQKKELNVQLAANLRHQEEQQKLLTLLHETEAVLKLAVQTRDDFMSTASHELKTPLTALRLQSQIRMRHLQNNDVSGYSADRLSKMFRGDERNFERITHLIDDMLDISRIGLGKLSMSKEKFDLCDLVRDIVQLCSDQLTAAGCEVKIDVCAETLGIWDRFRIEQVITNLLTNAMRYGANAPVSVLMTATKDSAQISICDGGRGIAKENQERIFQRFERAVTGNEISGLGLGLYIVKQILVAHGGSTFVVNLPLHGKQGEGSATVV